MKRNSKHKKRSSVATTSSTKVQNWSSSLPAEKSMAQMATVEKTGSREATGADTTEAVTGIETETEMPLKDTRDTTLAPRVLEKRNLPKG